MTNNRKSTLPLTLDLQFFADDTPPADETKPPADNAPKTVTMTQDELDALIIKEKGRIKAKFADYDDLKTKASEFEAERERMEREKMSELERLQADLKAKEDAEKELADKIASYEKADYNRKFKKAFTDVARGLEVANPEVAFKLADLDGLALNDDGKIDGLEDVLTAMKEQYDFLNVPKKPAKPIGGGDLNPEAKPEKTAEMRLKEAADKARSSGRQEDRAAYAALKRELGL